MFRCSRLIRRGLIALAAAPILLTTVSAGGLYNSADARSAALGGEETAEEGSVLSAMDSNPAALATMPRAEAAITLTGALLRGEFQAGERSDHLRSKSGFVGSAAVEIPPPNEWPVRFGLAVIPDLTLESDWRYLDAAGGLGGATSYGRQTHHSRILSLRTTAAVAARVTRWLSLGASAIRLRSEPIARALYLSEPAGARGVQDPARSRDRWLRARS